MSSHIRARAIPYIHAHITHIKHDAYFSHAQKCTRLSMNVLHVHTITLARMCTRALCEPFTHTLSHAPGPLFTCIILFNNRDLESRDNAVRKLL